MSGIAAQRNEPSAFSKKLARDRISGRLFLLVIAIILLALLGFTVNRLRYDLRSYALLTHFVDPNASGTLLNWETHAVATQEVAIPTADGPVRARLYLPTGVPRPRGMVAVPGIHRLGIDEPRLVSFARALAGSGLAVLTPQVDALADYNVDSASISTIGESAVWLDRRLNEGPVTVTGISFAGGLSLLAACDLRYAPHIRALVLMGAYDDLARVSRFLATNQEELPDGRVIPFPAHDYGASVFVYSHLAQFFQTSDLAAAQEALRYWLWEQPENAKPSLDRLSPGGRTTMDALMLRRIDLVRARLLDAIRVDGPELASVSPHGNIANLHAAVFVLHGSEDNVIPPAESLWLGKDIPSDDLRSVVITGAFSHVDPKKDAGWYEQLRLVRFVAAVLRIAD